VRFEKRELSCIVEGLVSPPRGIVIRLQYGGSESLSDPEEDDSHRLCLSLLASLTCISKLSNFPIERLDVMVSRLSFCEESEVVELTILRTNAGR
jgi:hypothetical protein